MIWPAVVRRTVVGRTHGSAPTVGGYMLPIFAKLIESGEDAAGPVVEESTVEPAFRYFLSRTVLLGEPPEQSGHVIMAAQLGDKFLCEHRLPVNRDGVELGVSVRFRPSVVVVRIICGGLHYHHVLEGEIALK